MNIDELLPQMIISQVTDGFGNKNFGVRIFFLMFNFSWGYICVLFVSLLTIILGIFL
jgi:hypothetical protein